MEVFIGYDCGGLDVGKIGNGDIKTVGCISRKGLKICISS